MGTKMLLALICVLLICKCRGTGGGNPGVMGAGSVREAGEERVKTGYPRGRELGGIGNEFRNIAQYFAIEKAHRDRNQ